jgi:acyl-CoA thioester hydrolase
MSNLPSSGLLTHQNHSLPIRIYYEDTDFSGVVYHASYLRFLERGRTEYIRALNLSQGELFETGAAFMVRSMMIDYLRPAKIDDILNIETKPLEAKGASLLLEQKIYREQELLILAKVKIAYVIHNKPNRLPEELRRIFTPF